jgi:heme-degrading monooxygenase HmoA
LADERFALSLPSLASGSEAAYPTRTNVTETSMTTVGMNYYVIPGKEAAFENAFHKVIHSLRQAPGHSETRLFKEVDDPGHYLIVSDWNDKAAFEAFISSDVFRAVADWGKEQILRARPEHRVYGE